MKMYDLQSKLNTFYKNYVVLPKSGRDSLFTKKNLNINRLKDGLIEYNEEKGTDYKFAEEPIVQGSVAMSTVIQNDSNDYDIDVAIVFEKDNLPPGTTATKNVVVNALKKKTNQFKVEPEAKTNCVRIVYAEGYHIDFAIYRRYKDGKKYIYEHCGSEWRERDPRSLTQWFLEQNKEKDYKLREVVRLLKMFSKSRDGWKNMPGGLIQSVLANEQFQTYERIDERFYYTIKAIKDRLAYNKEVYNPTDSTKSLKLVSKDSTKMDNLYNRLKDKLSKLDILFTSSCTYNQAIEAWGRVFNHDYWAEQREDNKSSVSKSFATSEMDERYDYKETEEFIYNKFPINIQYQLELKCEVLQKNKSTVWLHSLLNQKKLLLPGCYLKFMASTNVPSPYNVYWKVKNRGDVAKREDCIRGQIEQTDELSHFEPTLFKGDHYVECYIVKEGICVAKQRIGVPIKVS
ncbi:nucleotide-binding domain-containing protein [Piscibacillus salipiscarius]|uniref:nucleotide-binding domain-containing protein n=1 Tax=Piscibacillus salipiscarius TaxID=299480 RepID=UPI000B31B83E|nr:nucleotidyltransferase [Piscibacillus salipiscarius]